MQKKLRSLFIAASFIITASLIFIACGGGNLDLLENYQGDIVASDGVLQSKINNADTNIWTGSPPIQTPSSWEPPPPPSSEAEPTVSSEKENKSSESSQKSSSSVASEKSSSSAASEKSSSSAKSSNSTAQKGDCYENNPKSGFTCSWDGYSSGAILAPGKILKPKGGTLPSGCTVSSWSFSPDTASFMLKNFCEKIDDSGTEAEAEYNYVLFAELKCGNDTHINACEPKKGWSSKKAPELKGTCKWYKDATATDATTETTTSRGATPKGVEVVDTDKVCSKSSVVYKYEYDGNTKDWSKDGVLSEWKSWPDDKKNEIYDHVIPTLECAEYSVPVEAEKCPALTVKAGSDHSITCSGSVPAGCDKNEIKMKNNDCVDIEVNWTQQGNNPPLKILCGGSFTGSTEPTSSITITYGSNTTTGKGTWSISNHALVLTNKLETGKTVEFLGVCVSYTTTGTMPATVSCQLGAYQ